jgi:TolB-like protein/Tfp pilus assembly protein PilF
LQAALKDVLRPLIAEHHGRIVKLMGDGLLVEFASVVDAVECAVACQNAMTDMERDRDENVRLRFRIGINLGDVIIEGEDIYGDGVNVAARLEPLAEPGGICVSSGVYDQVRNKTGHTFRDIGPQALKNIARPVHAYALQLGKTAGAPATPADSEAAGTGAGERPSIAVLPFKNLSGDADQEYFADGVSEDIITALSRNRWLMVIARNSSFTYKGESVDLKQVGRQLGVRYVLDGSVRKGGDRIRIAAQMIDASSGQQMWAERYDRVLEDIFAVQDEVTEAIVAAIAPELGKAEQQLEAALSLDPSLSPACSGLVDAYYYQVVLGLAGSVEENRNKALQAARRAVELDPDDAAAHCAMGKARIVRQEHALAAPDLQLAIDLNPSLAWAHYGLGAAAVFSGHAEQAITHLEDAIRLSPRDQHMGSFMVRLAEAYLLKQDYPRAVEWARKALQQQGFQWSRYAALLAGLGFLGEREQAQRVLGECLAERPDFSVSMVRDGHLYTDAAALDHYLDGLRQAGVPE